MCRLLPLSLLTAFAVTVGAFVPSDTASFRRSATALKSSSEAVRAADIKARYEMQMEKLREKDGESVSIGKEDLKVVYEDDHIVVVDKPAGVLCVPGRTDNPSLNEAVFDAFGCQSGRMDKMVVHRLGMDTSGLVVFARTERSLKGMNALFRNRSVTRKYEALLCGHVDQKKGKIDMPLMRDYEHPPYFCVSTDERQKALIGIDRDEVDKKLLENPKECLTEYEVVSLEHIEGHPVTRVTLNSVTGRTHQLNVHCAAFGHPIVGDTVYGINGEGAANGGLDEEAIGESAPDRASVELQQQIADAWGDKPMCIHAKAVHFKHPVTKERLHIESPALF